MTIVDISFPFLSKGIRRSLHESAILFSIFSLLCNKMLWLYKSFIVLSALERSCGEGDEKRNDEGEQRKHKRRKLNEASTTNVTVSCLSRLWQTLFAAENYTSYDYWTEKVSTRAITAICGINQIQISLLTTWVMIHRIEDTPIWLSPLKSCCEIFPFKTQEGSLALNCLFESQDLQTEKKDDKRTNCEGKKHGRKSYLVKFHVTQLRVSSFLSWEGKLINLKGTLFIFLFCFVVSRDVELCSGWKTALGAF